MTRQAGMAGQAVDHDASRTGLAARHDRYDGTGMEWQAWQAWQLGMTMIHGVVAGTTVA